MDFIQDTVNVLLTLLYSAKYSSKRVKDYTSRVSKNSSSSVRSDSGVFVQLTPLHPPHAAEHFMVFFRQEHLLFLQSPLQPQRIISSKEACPGGKLVRSGMNFPFFSCQPHLRVVKSMPFHCWTWRNS